MAVLGGHGWVNACAWNLCRLRSTQAPKAAWTGRPVEGGSRKAWASRVTGTHGSHFCLGLLLLFFAIGVAAGAEPKRVLLIYSFGRDFAPYNAFSGVLRTELVSQSSKSVDLLEVSLESARFGDTVQESLLVNYLAALSAGRLLDLVIPIGGPAVQFAQRHRQALFPRTPLLIAGTDERHIQQAALTPNDAVVAGRIELSRIVQTILQVLPETTNVVVVIGASPLEKFWLKEVRNAYQPLTNRVSFQWLHELSFAEMLKRCAALPPRSALFYALMAVDAEGVPQWEEGALTQLHEVANAPLFGVFGTQLGRGIVGGPLMDMEEMGRNTAKVATRILRGEAPGDLRILPQEMGIPQFDWRELRRWGIREARLPAGSEVRFRPPGVWEHYWWLACGAILFGALQAALIVGLLMNRTKRRHGEAVTTLIADLSSRFINLPPAKVDREIEEAQRSVCESMGLDLSALWQWTDGSPRYFKMTHLYRPLGGPPVPERFDAQEIFPWCLKHLLAGKAIPVSSMDALPPEAARDRESWLHFGIKSNLTFPLLIEGGQLIGGLSFNTVRKARSWPEGFVSRLELVAQIFANALARKRADQELRESEARLSLAADAAAMGLWRLDLATRCFWVTTKTRELFAFGADEVVTFDRFLSLVHPADQSIVRQAVQDVLQSIQGEVQVEYRILRSNGRVQWMHSQGRVQTNRSGQPDYLMGVTVDISPRKQAEKARRGSEARLASAVEVAGLGFYDMGSDPGQIFVDERLRSMLGLTPQDHHRVQGFWMEHIHPDDRERVQELSRRVLGGELPGVALEYRYLHPERGTLWFSHVSRAQEQDATGKVVRRFGVIRDISEQRRAELESQRLRGNLEHLTRVNTLGALSGSLAHELNQPLGIILSNAQAAQELLTQEPPDTAEVQAILADIVKADRRAGEIIDRLRALFKGGPVSLQQLSLNDVIEEVLRLVHAELLGRGVTVIRELASGLPPVTGDRVQLQQLVLNLVLNAADAMAARAPGTRRLHLQTMPQPNRVRASVRDEGEGLPTDVERLFQPLYTTKLQGLGMGLAICRSIVGVHEGRLWAERHPGRGAVFHFELPVTAETGDPGQMASGGPERPRPSPVTHHPPPTTLYERNS